MTGFHDRNFVDGHYLLKCNNFNTAIAADPQYFPASASFIDMADLERIVFLIELGTLTSDLVAEVFQDKSATATGSLKTVNVLTQLALANDADNKWGTIEVARWMLDSNNDFRYVTLKITGGAGGDDYVCVTAIGIGPGGLPVTQPANMLTPVTYVTS